MKKQTKDRDIDMKTLGDKALERIHKKRLNRILARKRKFKKPSAKLKGEKNAL